MKSMPQDAAYSLPFLILTVGSFVFIRRLLPDTSILYSVFGAISWAIIGYSIFFFVCAISDLTFKTDILTCMTSEKSLPSSLRTKVMRVVGPILIVSFAFIFLYFMGDTPIDDGDTYNDDEIFLPFSWRNH